MTQYQGNVQSYVLEIQSPNSPYDQKAVISLHGAFGLAILYFVPQDGQLGKNQKRAGQEIFDIYYWMDSWPHLTDLLRNEKPVQFALPFLVGQSVSPTGSSKPTSFLDKSKKIYNQPCAALCRPI
jgi:hypothetical protein